MSGAQPVPAHVLAIQQISRSLYARRWQAAIGLVALLVILFLFSGVRVVHNGQRGVLRRFGRVVDGSVAPGVNYVVPLVERLDVMEVGAVNSVAFGEAVALITGDENLVNVTGQVQCRVDDPGRFTTSSPQPEKLIRIVAEEVLTREVSWRRVDDVLTTDRSALQESIREGVQAAADRAHIGMSIIDVALNVVSPPPEARPAFAAVADAASEREKKINEAEGRASQALSLAGAEADEQRRGAAASATEQTESARSAAISFEALAEQAQKAHASAEQRLFRKSVAQFLQAARVIILPGDGSREHLRLDLKGTAVTLPAVPPLTEPDVNPKQEPEMH
jgi:modulator of FtsH protease HflK